MKEKKKIKIEAIIECGFLEGDCKYGNPENKNKCIGCRFSRVIKQTPSPILSKITGEKEK